MDILRPDRDEALLAVACGLWAAYFLAGHGTVAVLATPLIAVAVLAYRRWPVLAALTVASVSLGLDVVVGVSSENPGVLAAAFVVVFALGRFAPGRRSMIPLGVWLAAFVVPDPTAPTIVFGGLLLGSVWAFGLLVRRRTEAADRAAATAEQLVALDAGTRAEQAVAEERARLAGETLAVIRAGVHTMLQHADGAVTDLDPAGLEAVQDEGRRVTSELRRLLGLLRSEPERTSGTPARPAPRRSRWRRDLVTGVALPALCLLEVSVTPELTAPLSATTVGLSLLMAASVGMRRVSPGLACAVALVPPALGLALDLTLPYGLWSAVVAGMLAWSVTTVGRLRDLSALGVVTVALVLDVAQHHPGNEAMTVVVVVLAGIAGHLWAARDREERSASAVAVRLRAEHEAVAERAVRAERLRLARDLHDVTSHAVGVMVLQAGAAAALRDREPQQARDAVVNVQASGVRALSELEALFGLLEAGAVGPAGLAADGSQTALVDRLEALIARMEEAGLRISLVVEGGELAELPPQVAATAYRVVHEALTNVMRHAPGARVEVSATRQGGVLEVCVRDEGSQPGVAPVGDGGFGLVGLDERVRAHGGELATGRRTEGGFSVVARLPVARQPEVRQ